jgi:hypothetical protein
MTTHITIRRNATTKIKALLAKALVISGQTYDDQLGDVFFTKTPEQLIADLPELSSVYARADDGGKVLDVCFNYHRGRTVMAWLDIEHARRTLHVRGFARIFPNDPQSIAFVAEQAAAKAAAEHAAKSAELEEERRLCAQPEPSSYAVGDRFIARFASLNKNSTAEAYRAECIKPHMSERNHANWYDELCEVEAVLFLPRREFSWLASNLLESHISGIGEGGTNSDYQLPEGVDVNHLRGADLELFIAQSYRMVTVVVCPGCRPLVIDCQGYSYPRNVGLWPRSLEKSNVIQLFNHSTIQ